VRQRGFASRKKAGKNKRRRRRHLFFPSTPRANSLRQQAVKRVSAGLRVGKKQEKTKLGYN